MKCVELDDDPHGKGAEDFSFGSGSTPKRPTLQPTVNKSDIRKEVLVGTRLLADCPMTFHTESSESSISTSTSTSTSTTTLSPFKPAKLAVACEQFDPMHLVECDTDIDNVPPGGWPKGASPPYLQVAAALDEVIATRSRIMKDNIPHKCMTYIAMFPYLNCYLLSFSIYSFDI